MTHFSKCDIFNQFHSFKAIEWKNPICWQNMPDFFFFAKTFTQMNISNLKSTLEQKRNSVPSLTSTIQKLFTCNCLDKISTFSVEQIGFRVRTGANCWSKNSMQCIYQQMKYRKLPKRNRSKETKMEKNKRWKKPSQKTRCEDTHEICICYVKIINFKIGFYKNVWIRESIMRMTSFM